MADTATAHPDAVTGLRDLAIRHGLRPAGKRPGLAAYTRRVWFYRHFISAYADAKLVASFDNARLGRLWQVLTPLTNAAVYYLLFGVLLNTRAGVPNFVAYLCIGLFVFNFTQTVVLSGLQSITGSLGLIRALHFPRACLPIAAMLTQLQHMLASVFVLALIVLFTGEPLTLQWVQLAPALLLQATFNAGLALFMARLGAKLTDLRQVMPFVLRTWMYGSGVLYSVRNFTENLPHAVASLVRINPMLVYIDLVRDALLDSSPLATTGRQLWIFAACWSVLVGFGGYVYFWLGEQEYGRG
jgi:teichoic acid transport system permease protein